MITEYRSPNKLDAKKFIISSFVIILVWAIVFIFFSASDSNVEKLFVIESGESINSIATRLVDDGYINSSLVFKSYLQLSNKGGQIKAGEHYLSGGMSIADIINILIVPTAQQDKQITLIEGWSNLDIADYLVDSIGMQENDFLAATNLGYPDYEWLPNKALVNYTQGYLFPDTYRILPQSSAKDIVEKLLYTFNSKVYMPLLSSIDKSSMSLHEIVTLASIVEAEVSLDSDRQLVVDIFLRRLADNYPLQSDATVNYVTKSGRAQSTIKDTQVDSPYNTYRYAGLPPGPIGNPSLSSIKAVLNPVTNTYYFFLTTNDDGRVIYSRTYEEHLQNKAKYLD